MNAVAVASRAQLCVNPEVRAAAGASGGEAQRAMPGAR